MIFVSIPASFSGTYQDAACTNLSASSTASVSVSFTTVSVCNTTPISVSSTMTAVHVLVMNLSEILHQYTAETVLLPHRIL